MEQNNSNNITIYGLSTSAAVAVFPLTLRGGEQVYVEFRRRQGRLAELWTTNPHLRWGIEHSPLFARGTITLLQGEPLPTEAEAEEPLPEAEAEAEAEAEEILPEAEAPSAEPRTYPEVDTLREAQQLLHKEYGIAYRQTSTTKALLTVAEELGVSFPLIESKADATAE